MKYCTLVGGPFSDAIQPVSGDGVRRIELEYSVECPPTSARAAWETRKTKAIYEKFVDSTGEVVFIFAGIGEK